MSCIPRDWDNIDLILQAWAIGRGNRYGPASGRNASNAGGDDAQFWWGWLRVEEALGGIEPARRSLNIRDMAMRAYTERPQLLREPPIVELRGIVAVLVEANPFRVYQMAGPPVPQKKAA